MKTLLARSLVATLVATILGSTGAAQERRKSDDSVTKTLKLLKAPESPAEFWDAVKFSLNVGKTEDAAKYLDKLLTSNPPSDLLLMIREQDAVMYFPKLSASDELRAKAVDLLQQIEQAARERARDPERIRKFIDYLTRSSQQQAYGITQLRNAGPDAVPYLLAALRDPVMAEHRSTILTAMQRLDRSAEPPLVAALATDDHSQLTDVIQVLTVLGDIDTVQHLRFIAESPAIPQAIQSLARTAVQRITRAKYSDLPAATDALTAQARRYYEHQAELNATSTGIVRLWRWDPREGAKSKEVSVSYAEEFFGLGHCRQALALDPNYEPAQLMLISLALEKASQRVGIDQQLPDNPGGAAVEALAAGPELLSKVLVMALDQGHPAVALRSLQALARTGDMNALAPRAGRPSPLVQAMTAPDRRIQFAAAEAVLSLRPQQPYPGTTLVAPILARSLVTDGTEKALVVDADNARGSALSSLLREAGYDAQFVTNSREAFTIAAESADFDLIFLDPNIHNPNLSPTLASFRADPRTAGVPIIVLGDVGSLPADPLHESLMRGDMTKLIAELRRIGDQIGDSKLEKQDQEELQKELARAASKLQDLSPKVNIRPPSRVFVSVFVEEMNRLSRVIGIVKADRTEKETLQAELAKLADRVDRVSGNQIVARQVSDSNRSLPRQEDLAKFERYFPRVKSFLRPTTMEILKLQLDPFMASLQSKPLTAAERAEYARRAAAWVARIARGEIRGIELRSIEMAILSVLDDETLGPDAIAAASLMPGEKPQVELARLISNESAPMPLRLEAARQLSQSLRLFGVLLPTSQVATLRKLVDQSEEPTFHQALASVVGSMKPRKTDTGQRLGRLPTPAFDPAASPAEAPEQPGKPNEEPAAPVKPATPRSVPAEPAAPAKPLENDPAAKKPTENTKPESNSEPEKP